MMGFEMAYIPVGKYYVASAQQVIAEEHRGKLTEMINNDQVFIQATVGSDSRERLKGYTTSPVVAKFPFDSFIPLDGEKLNNELLHLKGEKVSITGFASLEGAKKYNKRLSQKRAERVARIAKTLGVKVEAIKSVGESECNAKNRKDFPKCRKVEIYPLSNGGNP